MAAFFSGLEAACQCTQPSSLILWYFKFSFIYRKGNYLNSSVEKFISGLQWNYSSQEIDQSCSTGSKVITCRDKMPFHPTYCSRQEPSDSFSISLLTLPWSLLPLVSFAKLTALKCSIIIFVIAFVKVMITLVRNLCRYMLCN